MALPRGAMSLSAVCDCGIYNGIVDGHDDIVITLGENSHSYSTVNTLDADFK